MNRAVGRQEIEPGRGARVERLGRATLRPDIGDPVRVNDIGRRLKRGVEQLLRRELRERRRRNFALRVGAINGPKRPDDRRLTRARASSRIGTAIAAMIPTIATTIRSSMSVNPDCRFTR